ncbi:GTPase-associated protein 1-related protein [Actinomadura sp. 3N508]|uniref:GTPase-associated protein 1-related protein n=1 Tax=Actinomadura sp. 3N508 TaxID=3375153 RepID=UPI00378BCF37
MDEVREGELWRFAYHEGGDGERNSSPRVVGPVLPQDLQHRLNGVVALTCWPPLEGALSHSRLPDGGALLCATSPDDARVEALYLAGGVGDLLPIDTWHSPSWSRGQAVAPEPGEGISREALARFARDNASRVAPFLADVRRLFASPAGRQIVLIESRPEAVAHWIALACASLPGDHARTLTFTTRTAYPHRAPQQILGIGPDVDFDRSDPATIDHLYRVHDALGGQSSPPVTDLWDELAARLWWAGMPPAEVSSGTVGFDPGPLATYLLHAPFDNDALWRLESLSDELLHGLAGILTTVVRGDDPPFGSLTWLCRRLAERDIPAAELAMAIAQHRLSAAQGPPFLADLPLGTRERDDLYREFGPRIEQDLLRHLGGPIGTWAPDLEFLLGRGPVADALGQAAADRLADLLLGPADDERDQALAFLNLVTDTSIPYEVLRRLENETRSWAAPKLAVRLAAFQGEWLRSAIEDDTWLPFRLAEVAFRRDDLTGPGLLAHLFEHLPGGGVQDVRALEFAWWLVWCDAEPGIEDLPELARICPLPLIFEARLERWFLPWLTNAERFDDKLIELAAGLGSTVLNPREKATRELLLCAREFAEGMPPLVEAVGRLMEWRSRADPTPALLDGVFGKLAAGLAQADPEEFCKPRVLELLRGEQDPGLAHHYRKAVMADIEQHINRLVYNPRKAHFMFCAWSHLNAATPAWGEVCQELLEKIIGAVWQRMDDRRRRELDDLFANIERGWQETWTNWRASQTRHTNVGDQPQSGTKYQRGPA